MSPYIFILCIEVLAHNITHDLNTNMWDPINISKTGPYLSHLFFADNLVLMFMTDRSSYINVKNTLQNFCTWSGQSINYGKLKILFSNNYDDNIKSDISSILNINFCTSFEKYLGFPIFSSKPTAKNFQFVIDNLRKNFRGGKQTS